MVTHSSLLAWEILWTEAPGGLQSTGSQRVRHDRVCTHIRTNAMRVVGNGISDSGLLVIDAGSRVT